MKKSIWESFSRFFGPSRNDEFAAMLLELADTASAGAAHFRKTTGQDLKGIIEYEHKGDAIVDRIHELLDNSFILRFDIPDAMRLTDDLDNVIDGMRKVAIHIDIYQPFLADLRPDAIELVDIAVDMMGGVRKLILMLAEPRLSLARVREVATVVDQQEAAADKLVSAAERRLVTEFGKPGANALEFLAWEKLYQMLEETTDEANHCARQILSLARKEA